MKLNKKSKNKGKVHPSPQSSSSSSSTNSNDTVSNLNKLLPTTILTLISVLSLQDKQVLAYMITHSLSSTTTTSSFFTSSSSSSSSSTNPKSGKKLKTTHKTPTFDCGCFDCYTTYWFRWDSSPHRQLIHQAIEAFEDHLLTSEQPIKATTANINANTSIDHHKVTEATSSVLTESPENREDKKGGGAQENNNKFKGLARKLLPDVIGFFNSRLWSLWGPNL